MLILTGKRSSILKLLLLVCFGGFYIVPVAQNLENITLTITFDSDTADYSAIKAPLKYNKRFALSMQVTNSSSSVFELGFPVFEGGTVNGNTFDGMKFTDGCNNFHSFKMTSVNYILVGDPITGFDIHNNPSSGKVSWQQLDTLNQSLWGIANSGINTDAFEDPEFVNYSIARNRSYIHKKMYNSSPHGIFPNVFVNPNGNPFWSDYAFELGSVCAFNKSQTFPIGIEGGNVNDTLINWAENKYNLYNKDITSVDIKDFVDLLASSSIDSANYWSSVYTSSLVDNYNFTDFVFDFNYINNTYGSDGSDEILMTTDEEILNYLFIRDAVTLNQTFDGNELTLTFSGDIPNDLRYYDLSIVLEADANITDITIVGTEDFSVSDIGGTDALINFSWEGYNMPSAEATATNYTQIATQSQNVYDAVIAMDYVSVVEYGEAKNNLVNQLCSIPNVPYDEGFCESGYPDFVKIIGDTLISAGESTTLAATNFMYSYRWSTGQTTRSISVSPGVTSKIWVDAVTMQGNAVTDTIVISVTDSYIINHSPLLIEHSPGVPDSLWVELEEGATCIWENDSTTNYLIIDPNLTTNYHLNIIYNSEIVNQLDFVAYVGDLIEFTFDSVCFGNTTTFINTSIVNDSVVKVLWDIDGDTQFDDAEGDTVTYTFSESGNNLVGMRLYFHTSPMDVVYNPVPVGDLPTVDFEYEYTCFSSTTMFNDLSTTHIGIVDHWIWDFGDGKTDNFQSTSNYYDAPGNYDVKLIVETSAGCTDSLQKTIQINESPRIILKTTSDIVIENNDTIYFSKGGTTIIVLSNFSDYDSAIWYNDERGQTITIAEEGNFTILGYKNGCVSKQYFNTKWDHSTNPSGHNIMNLFTPNGDGFNDLWVINEPEISMPFSVTVYNRSGKQVYNSNNYLNTWDGQYNGNPLPQATYYFIIEDAVGNTFKGAVTIIR